MPDVPSVVVPAFSVAPVVLLGVSALLFCLVTLCPVEPSVLFVMVVALTEVADSSVQIVDWRAGPSGQMTDSSVGAADS